MLQYRTALGIWRYYPRLTEYVCKSLIS